MERVWAARLRWRLRGAWLAPLLVLFTFGDALLLHALPLAGEQVDLFASLLLAGFFNLVAVAALAPFAGIALRRLRPDLPRLVARNYAGTVLVVLVAVALTGAGLHHHATVERDRTALAVAHARGVAWIGAQAPSEFRRRVARADTVAIVAGSIYRTCAPGATPDRAWCVVVDTRLPFPRGIRFGGGEPNARFQAGRG
jgi:hypothetical protein